MFLRFLYKRKKPPSERMALAYQRAQQQFVTWLVNLVRKWETQPIRTRKMQLILGLAGLLLLSCVSVYFTATGHFLTRINQNHHEQQLRRK